MGAGLLLLVVGAVTAALAEGVGFGVAFTSSSSTFGLHGKDEEKKARKTKARRRNIIS